MYAEGVQAMLGRVRPCVLVAAPSPVTGSDPCPLFSPVILHECEEQQFLFIHLAQNCVGLGGVDIYDSFFSFNLVGGTGINQD